MANLNFTSSGRGYWSAVEQKLNFDGSSQTFSLANLDFSGLVVTTISDSYISGFDINYGPGAGKVEIWGRGFSNLENYTGVTINRIVGSSDAGVLADFRLSIIPTSQGSFNGSVNAGSYVQLTTKKVTLAEGIIYIDGNGNSFAVGVTEETRLNDGTTLISHTNKNNKYISHTVSTLSQTIIFSGEWDYGSDVYSMSDLLKGNDNIYGTASSDFMDNSLGNDNYYGGLGVDTVIFNDTKNSFQLSKDGSGITVTSKTSFDFLSSIERVEFSNLSIAFDTDAANNAGGIYRLYKAALNRTPDLVGLGYWIAQADAGSKDAVQMATDFAYADEFKTLYSVQTTDNYMTGEDITALVTKIYENVLDRAPDADGRDYYAGQITTHSKTFGQVLAEISDSTENKLAVVDLIATGIEYTPWVG